MASDFVQKLLLQFEGDPDGAKGAIKDLVGALKDLGEDTKFTAHGIGESLMDAFEHPLETAKGAVLGAAKEFLDTFGMEGIVLAGVGGAAAGITLAMYEATKQLHEFVIEAAHVGEHLNDINEKTGITVPVLSQMRYVIEAAGGNFDRFSNAMFQFERRMETTPDKLNKGLKMIGLSLRDIADLSMDQRFLEISHAITETQDPAKRSAAAFQLFGNMGREMIPLMMTEMDGLIERSKELAVTWTQEEAQAAQDLLIAERELKLQWKAIKEFVGKGLIPTVRDYVRELQLAIFAVRAFAEIKFINPALNALAWIDAARGVTDVGGAYNIAAKQMLGMHQAVEENLEAEFMPTMADAKRAWKEMDEKAKEHAKTLKKAQEEQKKWNALLKGFTVIEGDNAEMIDKIDGEVVEGIKYYLERGKAVGDIAKLYGLESEQVAAVKKELDAYNKAVETSIKNVDESRRVGAAAAAEIGKGLSPVMFRLRNNVVDAVVPAKDFNLQVGLMPDLSRNARAKMRELTGGMVDFGNVTQSTLQTMPSLIIQSLTGGGGVQGALQAGGSFFGQKLGSNIAANLTERLTDGGAKAIGGLTKGLLNAIPVAGALIGPALGALFGKLFSIGGPSKEELAGRDVEKKFEQSFGGFDKMMDAVGKAYLATGRTAQQAQADVKALLDAERQGPEVTQKWIDKIKGVVDAAAQLPAKAVSAAQSFAAAFAIPAAALKSYDDLNAKQMELSAKVAEERDPLRQKELQEDLDRVNKELATQAGIWNATMPHTREQADALATAVVADFGAMLKHGVSFTDAVKNIAPAVGNLESMFNGMGDVVVDTTTLGGDAFKELKTFVDLASDAIAGPAITSTQNLAAGMRTLDEIGLGNTDTYAGLGNQIGATFAELQRQGVDGNVLLVAMRDQIQTVWEQQQKYGFLLDDSTQKMVDQAKAQGLVGPQMRSINEQLLSVLQSIDSTLKGMTGNALNFAGALNNIPRHIETEIVTTHRSVGADTEEIPSFAGRPMERVVGTGYALLHPGDVVGVPQPGQFGAMGGDSPYLASMANGIDALNDRIDALADVFARKVRDAIQLAG